MWSLPTLGAPPGVLRGVKVSAPVGWVVCKGEHCLQYTPVSGAAGRSAGMCNHPAASPPLPVLQVESQAPHHRNDWHLQLGAWR